MPDLVGRTRKVASPFLSVLARHHFLPPGSVSVTVVPASTLRTRTRIVFSWPARTVVLLARARVHGACDGDRLDRDLRLGPRAAAR